MGCLKSKLITARLIVSSEELFEFCFAVASVAMSLARRDIAKELGLYRLCWTHSETRSRRSSMAEYAELISSTLTSFSIEDDIGAISRISESLLAARQQRQKRRQESRAVLTDLSRSLENARNQYQATCDSVEVDHGTVMNALDREKFGLAKGINDLEGQTHSLESQLRRIQHELDTLNEDVTKEPAAFDHEESTVLKLSVYRDLGIALHEDGGTYTRAVVRGASGKDVHMVSLEGPGGSYADHLWELCSS